MAKTKTAEATKVVELEKAKVVGLLTALGVKTVENWTDKRLLQKVKTLDTSVDEEAIAEKDLPKPQAKLLKLILKGCEDGAEFTLAAAAEESATETATPVDGEAKPAKAEKTAKEPKAPKEPKVKKVGVISTIIDVLCRSTSKNPCTKDDIVAELKAKFPEREERALRSTVNSQVPSGLRAEKDIEVIRIDTTDGKGYYVTDHKGHWNG